MNQQPTRMSGFTLIELVMVMVIIGFLGAIAIPRFSAIHESGEEAVVVSTLSALQQGYQGVMQQFYLAGSPGKGSNTLTNVSINGATVVFKNGVIQRTTDDAHVPAQLTIDRNAAPTLLFFLFMDDSAAGDIIRTTDDGPGWAMLGTNDDCAAGTNPRRCWEFRRGGQRVARITLAVKTGEFTRD